MLNLRALMFTFSFIMVDAQTPFCGTGYIMDTFCILRGTLFDNPSVISLLGPDKHSLHCLLDPPECINSGYELLAAPPPGQDEYVRAVKFDSVGNDMIVKLAKSFGRGCNGCTGSQLQGFRATVKGTIVDSNANPKVLKVTAVFPDTVVCNATVPPKTALPTRRPTTRRPTTRRPILRPAAV